MALPWVLFLLFVDGATFGVLTPPLLLESGKHHAPWQIGLLGGAASALGSMLQLAFFTWLLAAPRPWLERWAPLRRRLEEGLARYRSASFLGLVLMRATPVPDLPLKLVAAAGRYPIALYGLAVWLGAIPYYWLLAQVGEWVRIPTWLIVAGALVVGAVALGERLWRRRRRS